MRTGEVESDPVAVEIALRRYGLPPCLHVPVAARNLAAISRFVGCIESELSLLGTNRALLVRRPDRTHKPESRCKLGLPVWQTETAASFHANPQVWVHVDYRGYRRAYEKAHPGLDLSKFVIDHIENRRIARLKGWEYVRLCHISKSANTSSGGGSEKMGVEYFSKSQNVIPGRGDIRYGDVSDLAKMLGIIMGGQAGGMGGLVDALPLFDPSVPNACKICVCHRGSD